MLESSGIEGRNSDSFNVTEVFAANEAGQPRGYQRTGWEQSAALITAVRARALARSAGVGQQIDWECFMATQLTTGAHKRPSPPCAFHPKLDRCPPGELPEVLEQKHRLSGQQLAGDHTSNFSPAAAAMGEVLAMGDQPLVQVAGEQRDAVGAGVMPEEMAGHAGLAAATGAKHVPIEPGPVLDRINAGGLQTGEGGPESRLPWPTALRPYGAPSDRLPRTSARPHGRPPATGGSIPARG